jgi:beta-xylosidase/acetyl esterase/lipase
MRTCLAILVCLMMVLRLGAQSTAGITHLPDTSYNLASEYQKNLKNFPFISLAPETDATVEKKGSIAYCKRGEKPLLLDVFIPKQPSTVPRKAIIIIHGGGWRSGNKTLHHGLATKLATMGYVCFTPQYRLSTDALFPAAVNDVKAAIRWVRKQAASYNIDPKNISVAGHSAGGELAAFMGATNGKKEWAGEGCEQGISSDVQAVIDIDGILAFIHPESGEGDDTKRTSAATNWFGYPKSANETLWRQASPLTHVGPAAAPMLFLASSVDRMHAGRDDYNRALSSYGIYNESITFKGAPHSFILFNPWLDSAAKAMHAFLQKVYQPSVSRVWVPDNGDGTYRNPVIHADYSDPDAVRVGDDYYMISSSFNHSPGIPILHSKDLVNWNIIGHVLPQLTPKDYFKTVRHGDGVWAPSIRFHSNQFYVYYPEPELGIFVTRSASIQGPWTEPELVEGGKGLIDPCPLWDDDGKVYLVHAFAGSRAGIKSLLVIKEMNKEGTRTVTKGRVVYDGHGIDPTVEGPKLHKNKGYYYIFAPAGGVATGWQLVLRSKHIYGPYERKVVMDQGNTSINGPHQGAWVDDKTGGHWFLHFQDKGAYGRVVHLQPMVWIDGWPVIGADPDKDGKGEPVMSYRKPVQTNQIITPAESDEFLGSVLGLQWQWQTNTAAQWAFPYEGSLRLYAQPLAEQSGNYYDHAGLLTQKFPAEQFVVTTKLSLLSQKEGEKAGLMVFGLNYAYLAIEKTASGHQLVYGVAMDADKKKAEQIKEIATVDHVLFLRVKVEQGAKCSFSYSQDGTNYQMISEFFTAREGKWIGATVGLFCSGKKWTNDPGYAAVDWFRVTQ